MDSDWSIFENFMRWDLIDHADDVGSTSLAMNNRSELLSCATEVRIRAPLEALTNLHRFDQYPDAEHASSATG